MTATMSEGRKTLPTLRRRLSTISDCDIVKKGTLHMKRPPKNIKIRLKTWQTRYLVLRDDSYDQGCRLEIYQNEAAWEHGRHGDRIIDLRQVTHIEEYRDSRSFPFSLTVMRRGQSPLVLGTSCETEMREWVVAVQLLACKTAAKVAMNMNNPFGKVMKNGLSLSLSLNDSTTTLANRNNILNTSFDSATYHPASGKTRVGLSGSCPTTPGTPGKDNRKWGYHVEVLPSGSAQRNRLSGEFRLSVVADAIVLRMPDSDTEVMRWGLIHIRKFKSEDVRAEPGQEVVTLEANIHCGHREGTYMFKTPHGRELIARVRGAVRLLSMRRTSGSQSRETPSPRASMSGFGLRRKSESEPTLDMRISRTPSRDSSPDFGPPRQMAPRPEATNSLYKNHQGSPPPHWERDSSPEQDDDLPPPYLEVLAGDDDDVIPEESPSQSSALSSVNGSITSSSGASSIQHLYCDGPGTQWSGTHHEIPRDDLVPASPNPATCTRISLCRASIDSCPDVPPPPPPRPMHTMAHARVSPVSMTSLFEFPKNTATPNTMTATSVAPSADDVLPPPLPPRDF